MNFFVPLFIFFGVFFGIYKKIDVFGCFCEGVNEGLKTMLSIFPSILGLVVGVGMLKSSGFFDILSNILTPVCNIFHITPELVPIALLRPFSGSGTFSLLNNIFETTGVNSFASICSSVMCSSTETTFYTLAVYYGATKVTNTRHNLICSVSADIFSFILAVITTKFFF